MGTAIHPAQSVPEVALSGVGASRIQRQAVKKAWLWFWGWVSAIVLAWRIQRATIDPCAKCPACGARQGKIQWQDGLVWPDQTKGCVLHTCQVCSAAWGEKPIVQAKAWALKEPMEQRGDAAPFLNRPAPDQSRSFQ